MPPPELKLLLPPLPALELRLAPVFPEGLALWLPPPPGLPRLELCEEPLPELPLPELWLPPKLEPCDEDEDEE